MNSMLQTYFVGCLLLLGICLPTFSAAQDCLPDSTLQDAPLGLYPTPFDSIFFPDGGLADFPATIGEPYAVTFTLKLTDSLIFSPLSLDIQEFAFDATEGIMGLPIGLSYSCNPSNCVFNDTTLGCIIIEGTPIGANPVGDYSLRFTGQLFSDSEDSIALNFPSPVLPGEYILSLSRSDSIDTDEDGILDSEDNCVNTPNPEQIDEDEDGFGAACDCDDTPETGTSCRLGCQAFYLDEDGDGFGNPMDSIVACEAPQGFVANNLDCNDSEADINPDAIELMNNEMDDDCDGLVDELAGGDFDEDGIPDDMDNCPAIPNPEQIDEDNDGVGAACDCDDSELIGFNCSEGCITFYADNDGDGFGNPNIIRIACTSPAGFVQTATDCDDSDPDINPGEMEIPNNSIDDNCDGSIDETVSATQWFEDADGDGFGNEDIDSMSIAQPRGFVNNSDDCDDNQPLIYVGAIEIVDNLDNNCDGMVDNFEGACDDFTNPGEVGNDQTVCLDEPDPVLLTDIESPSGGSGMMEIMWMKTSDNPDGGNAQWTLIPGSHALTYDPPTIGQTTYFRRCVRRKGCSKFFQESNIITIILSEDCEGMVIEEEEEEEEVTVEEDPCLANPIIVNASVTQPDCDSLNASIDLMIEGGHSPFSYAWEPAFPDTNFVDSLPLGLYSVTILDSLNCFENFSVELTLSDTCTDGLLEEGFEFGRIQATVLEEKMVQLEWETQNENNPGRFLLEQSKDKEQFKALPIVKDAKMARKNNYLAVDREPKIGTSFYRIKYIKENGAHFHSSIIQVLLKPDGAPLFIAYPNPFNEVLNIDFMEPLVDDLTLTILDNLGQRIFQTTIEKGTLRKVLNLQESAKGLYNIQVSSEKVQWVKRVLKVE